MMIYCPLSDDPCHPSPPSPPLPTPSPPPLPLPPTAPAGMETCPQDSKFGTSIALLRQRVTSFKTHKTNKVSSGTGSSTAGDSPNTQRRSNFYVDPPIPEAK